MKSTVKISLLAGCIFGAVLGIAIALSLDFMMGGGAGSLNGGWYEAVQHDVGSWFGEEYALKTWVVYSGVFVVIALIGIIGALFGTIAGLIVGKALDVMLK